MANGVERTYEQIHAQSIKQTIEDQKRQYEILYKSNHQLAVAYDKSTQTIATLTERVEKLEAELARVKGAV